MFQQRAEAPRPDEDGGEVEMDQNECSKQNQQQQPETMVGVFRFYNM